MSERCERTSERRSEWPSTLRVDFIIILPNVRGDRKVVESHFLRSFVTLTKIFLLSVRVIDTRSGIFYIKEDRIQFQGIDSTDRCR